MLLRRSPALRNSRFSKRVLQGETSRHISKEKKCTRGTSRSLARRSVWERNARPCSPVVRRLVEHWPARRGSRCTRRVCRPGIIDCAWAQAGFSKALLHSRSCPLESKDNLPRITQICGITLVWYPIHGDG